MPTTTQSRNRVTIGKDGKPVFFIDNVRVSRKNYEETMGKYVETTEPEPEKIIQECPFCRLEGNEFAPTRTRFLNGEKVRVCEDHYINRTIGELAEAIRSLKDGGADRDADTDQ